MARSAKVWIAEKRLASSLWFATVFFILLLVQRHLLAERQEVIVSQIPLTGF
jgi:hypothetical protein